MVWSGRLETHDAQGDRQQPVQFEMRSYCGFNGSLKDGDEVELLEYDVKDGLARVLRLHNRETDTIVIAKSLKDEVQRQFENNSWPVRLLNELVTRKLRQKLEDPYFAWR